MKTRRGIASSLSPKFVIYGNMMMILAKKMVTGQKGGAILKSPGTIFCAEIIANLQKSTDFPWHMTV